MKRGWICVLAILFGLVQALYAETLAERSFEKLRANKPLCKEQFDFIVCGDSNSLVAIGQPKEFQAMIAEWNVLKPAFVVSCGDLILGGTAQDIIPQWDEFEQVVGKCEVPFFPVPGNHDINTVPEVVQTYEQRIGPLTYGFTYGNSRFIVLNSEENGAGGQISEKQLSWLKEDLSKCKADNIFLFMHQPYFIQDWDRHWACVADSLLGFPVRAVFAGHKHVFRDCGVRDGVHYYVTGGAGSYIETPEEEGGFFHYLRVQVKKNQVDIAVMRPGSVFPTDIITQERVDLIRALRKGLRTEPVEVPLGGGFDHMVSAYVENPLQDTIASSVTWKIPAGWHVEPLETPLSLAPGATAQFPFRIWSDGPAQTHFPVPAMVMKIQDNPQVGTLSIEKEVDMIPTTDSVYAITPVVPDGVLTEWTRATPMSIPYGVDFDAANTADLRAQARLMWDEGHVYVAVEAEDNEFHQPFGGDIVWSADSVELWLDGWVYSLSLTGQGPQVFLSCNPERDVEVISPSVKLGVTRNGNRIVYEATFNAADLAPVRLQAGHSYRFSILVNDLDPNGPCPIRHWLELTPKAGTHFTGPMLNVLLTK